MRWCRLDSIQGGWANGRLFTPSVSRAPALTACGFSPPLVPIGMAHRLSAPRDFPSPRFIKKGSRTRVDVQDGREDDDARLFYIKSGPMQKCMPKCRRGSLGQHLASDITQSNTPYMEDKSCLNDIQDNPLHYATQECKNQ